MSQQTDVGPGEAWSQRYHARRSKDGRRGPSAASRGSPAGRYVIEAGKAIVRRIAVLKDRKAGAKVRVAKTERARERADAAVAARKARHRGGDRTWLLRLLIPVAIVAEGVTAYVGMEVLVPSRSLAVGLATLAALVGAGLAGVLANRRLNQDPIPVAARVLEAVFVLVLTLLRYDSLHIQGADPVAAAGGAGLAALISALGLLGIEEILVETQTFGMFVGKMRAAWNRRQHDRATTQLDMICAQVEATGEKLEHHAVDFLLKEGMPLDEARQHAVALRGVLANGGSAK
jgi:hypothetical protein